MCTHTHTHTHTHARTHTHTHMHTHTTYLSLLCSAASGKAVKRERQSLGNQVIRKGWINTSASFLKGGHKEHWFVLTTEGLSWYKDQDVSYCSFSCLLNTCCMCFVFTGIYICGFSDRKPSVKDYTHESLGRAHVQC